MKGADSVVFERLRPDDPLREATEEHLHDFGCEGLRTLCVAVRDIDEATYVEWAAQYHAASTAIHNREEKVCEGGRVCVCVCVCVCVWAIHNHEEKVCE